jgi:hypothetical protein
MKVFAALLALSVQICITASIAQSAAFPKGPNQQLTPGSICSNPNSYRYPERIAYCNRNVASELKDDIIKDYDRQLGYQIEQMPRSRFKIDHYIPLCMGGANDRTNLWPQHESVYTITDQFEQISCDKMAKGVLSQKDAIELIQTVKNDLSKASEVRKKLEDLN